MGFNCLKATATSRRQFAFYHLVLKNSWYSFYQPQKDERLSWPWSHPVVLNTGPLNWESSVLTTSYCSMIVKLTKLTTGVGNQGNNKFKGLICGIRESLWFVSPHITTFEARSSSIPSILSKLCPLNDPTRHKHYARKLEKNTLLLLLSGIKTKLEKLYVSQQSFKR